MYIANRTEGRPGAPLLLTFHGTGGDEHQFHGLGQQILPEAHIRSPRGDVSEMGHARFFRRTGEGVYDMDDLAKRTAMMAAFIADEKARTGADRVLGLGYSNGANILASVALSQPDLVDDLVLLHPLIPWVPEPQPGLAGRRILITAGERDPICPPAQTQALVDYLTAQGALVETLWHPGGHEIAQAEIQRAAEALQAELPPVAAL
ncbi:MAG: alpha/beta hydrolase [Pseudomonadota bacterium]